MAIPGTARSRRSDISVPFLSIVAMRAPTQFLAQIPVHGDPPGGFGRDAIPKQVCVP
jgi:hypothetical protein